MNFIDKLLNDLNNKSADDIIQIIGNNIYTESIDRKQILKYPQFIQDIIFIIDLDTELSMNGDVLQNSIRLFIQNIITALENIHADNDAKLLKEIFKLDKINPDDKYINILYKKMYLYTDFDIWSLLEAYVKKQIYNFNEAK